MRAPWDFHSDLSLDRLQQVGKVLRDVREQAIRLHDPAGGDTPWVLGVRIYGRSSEILMRTGAELWDWFKVVSEPLEFVFAMGAVPLRFCHDDSDHVNPNHLRVSDYEARQIEIAFGDDSIDLIWRIVVESNSAGETKQVVLIGSTHTGDIRCKFVIPPMDGALSFIVNPIRPRVGPGVKLPPPIVHVKSKVRRKDADDDSSV